jgi:hypothetical protein
MLTLNPDAALCALIARQQRKGESLEALLLRLLTQRTRSEAQARAQRLKSLRSQLEFRRAEAARACDAVARLERELQTLIDPEDPHAP